MRTVGDFLRWEPLLGMAQRAELEKVPCPARILCRNVPQTIDRLSFESLAMLWGVKSSEDLFCVSGKILLGLPRWVVLRMPTLPMLGLVNFVGREIRRVNALWEEIPTSKTAEQIQAGVNRLNFGVFGIIDWYARRMGIQDHDQVLRTPWVRVYQCMKNDAEEREYQKRLQHILEQKARARR